MNGSRFATLNIRAPSMHGLQVSGRELRHRGWPDVVSEPDPRKIEKEGLVNGVGWKCTLRNFINCRTFRSQFELSAEPDTHKSVLIFPAWCLQISETELNAKTLVRLAFLINAHQNANQKPIGSAPACRVQCTLPPQLIYQTLLFDFSRVWFQD